MDQGDGQSIGLTTAAQARDRCAATARGHDHRTARRRAYHVNSARWSTSATWRRHSRRIAGARHYSDAPGCVGRWHPDTRQLDDDIVADPRTDGKAFGPPLAQASHGIGDRLAVDLGVKKHAALGVDQEITGHGDRHPRSWVAVGEKDVPVELQRSACCPAYLASHLRRTKL
jgi:hypothetical protein